MLFSDAINILRESDSLILDGAVISTPSIKSWDSMQSNFLPFITLRWEEDFGAFEVEFFEEDNLEVQISGSSMFLKDSDGEEHQITPTFRRNLEATNA